MQSAVTDLKNRGYIYTLDDKDFWRSDIKSIVYIGKIPKNKAEYDNQGNILVEPSFKEGFHVDVYSDIDNLEFDGERTFPENPYHKPF